MGNILPFPCSFHFQDDFLEKIQEVRIRLGQVICLHKGNQDYFTDEIVSAHLILKLLENFTNNSIYAVQSEINSGFITIQIKESVI